MFCLNIALLSERELFEILDYKHFAPTGARFSARLCITQTSQYNSIALFRLVNNLPYQYRPASMSTFICKGANSWLYV